MALYVGTNYHPHDWEEARWKVDIGLMKEAGLTTVRLGHLCWDSYEPEEGVYLVSREYLNETDKPMCFLEFQTGRPAVSVHRYGKGKAYYVAAKTDSELLRWLLRGLETEIGLQPALRVPHGVQARQIAENQCFYVNTTAKPVSIPLAQGGRGVRFPYGGGLQCNSKEKKHLPYTKQMLFGDPYGKSPAP